MISTVHSLDTSDTVHLIIGQIGSHAYGTNTESSDEDYMAVVLPNMSCYIGLDEWGKEGTRSVRWQDEGSDIVKYELHKFARLMLSFNPNVVPLLYLPERCYIKVHPGGRMLIDNRRLFESKRFFDTFNGFAKSQMHKVRDKITGKLGQKRKDLIAKYGYDVKFAMHTIRILRMAIEFCVSGSMNVDRSHIDAEELLEIKNGGWTEETFFDRAEHLISIVDSYRNDCDWIPDEPDYQGVNELVMGIIAEYGF